MVPANAPLPGAPSAAPMSRLPADGDAHWQLQCSDASPALGLISYDDFAETALGCWNEIYFAARRSTRNSADADDLVQETYHLAFRNYRELRDLSKCRPWLHRILHRQAITRYRRQHAGPSVIADGAALAEGGTPSTIADGGDPAEHLSLREIRDAVDALPTDLRIALTLCDIEGFTYAEIANRTGCPVGTVRSRIARARAKLVIKLRPQAEAWGIRRETLTEDVPRRPRERATRRLVA